MTIFWRQSTRVAASAIYLLSENACEDASDSTYRSFTWRSAWIGYIMLVWCVCSSRTRKNGRVST